MIRITYLLVLLTVFIIATHSTAASSSLVQQHTRELAVMKSDKSTQDKKKSNKSTQRKKKSNKSTQGEKKSSKKESNGGGGDLDVDAAAINTPTGLAFVMCALYFLML